MKNDVEALQ